MRWLALIFVTLILALQYPLWIGKGGWLKVNELETQLKAQKAHNARLTARNGALDAEVRDLKQGFDAIEERARTELGMVKPDEVYFQLLDAPAPPASTPAPNPPANGQPAGARPNAAKPPQGTTAAPAAPATPLPRH